MRIGVDATSWQNPRGYGRYVRNLFRRVVDLDGANEYVLYLDSREGIDDLPQPAEVRVVGTGTPATSAAAARSRRSLGDLWRTGRALSSDDLDVVVFPTLYTFVPMVSAAKKIVIIHDTIPETCPELVFPGARQRLFWRAKSILARRQCDALATVSDYSRRRIREGLRWLPDRIFVVGEAPDPVFRMLEEPRPGGRLETSGLDWKRRRLVYVGGFSPHKNLVALVDAFAAAVREEALGDLDLVLVGETESEVFHSNLEEVRRRVSDLGLGDRVVFTGFLPDQELVVLLNLSSALVLPSVVEGFGLPAVEAAACGRPVIATRESPLPELLGDGGLYVDPDDPRQLRTAIVRLLTSESLQQQMGRAALDAARRLSWRKAAGQMIAAIEEVASS